MKKIENFEQVKASGEFDALKPGGYIGVLYKAEDESDKEYLKVSFDIAEGEFADYYKNLYGQFNFWGGVFIRSYKEKALSMFKGFIKAVEESNVGYVWNVETIKSGKYKVPELKKLDKYTGPTQPTQNAQPQPANISDDSLPF